jgi:RNA polymerase sigma-70 factor (ECF subfamily)
MTANLEKDRAVPDVHQEFQALLARVRDGSEEAAWELIHLYGEHILRAVRRMLSDKLRPRFDSIDFVQSVWAALFTSRARIRDFETPDQLIGFLYAVARNKVANESRRRFGTGKHDVTREKQLVQAMEDAPESMILRTDTPSQIAVARERLERLLANQPERHRQIIVLRYAGSTFAEIAEQVGMNERSVRKVIDNLMSDKRSQE